MISRQIFIDNHGSRSIVALVRDLVSMPLDDGLSLCQKCANFVVILLENSDKKAEKYTKDTV